MSTLVRTLSGFILTPFSPGDLNKSTHPVLIQPLSKPHRTERENHHSEPRQRHHLRPQYRYTAALQEQSTHDFDEVPQRIEHGQKLNGLRHVTDRKSEAAQQKERLEKQERGHHGLLLRIRDGGDEQARAQRAHQKQNGAA